MHIFRWLMTHPIATAWILAALAILLNLNMGTKGGHDKVEHNTAHTEKSGQEVVVSESHAKTEDSAAATKSEADTTHQDQKNDQPVSLEAGQQVNNEGSNTAIIAPPSDTTSEASSENTTKNASDAVAKVAENDEKKKQVSAENSETQDSLESMKTDQLLQLAREAFWQGDKEKSVTIYQTLIKREPASLSHKGELANVYWHQEKQKESAALYAEIAVPMVKEGKTKEVANMVGFIGVFFPEKAAELQGLISQ